MADGLSSIAIPCHYTNNVNHYNYLSIFRATFFLHFRPLLAPRPLFSHNSDGEQKKKQEYNADFRIIWLDMRPFCASENEPRDMLTKYVGSEHWGWRQDERTTAKGAGDGSEPFFIFGCCCPLCSRQSHCLHQIFVFSRSGNSNGAQPFSPLSDPMIFFSYNAFDVFHCMRVCIHVYRSRCRWRTPLRCAHGMNLFHNWIHFNVNIIFFFSCPTIACSPFVDVLLLLRQWGQSPTRYSWLLWVFMKYEWPRKSQSVPFRPLSLPSLTSTRLLGRSLVVCWWRKIA